MSRADHIDFEFLGVLRGPFPAPGSEEHGATLIHWLGRPEVAVSIAGGRIQPTDQWEPLESQGEQGETYWLLIRREEARHHHPHILVVEDNEVNRDFYLQTLSQLDATVHGASTRAEAMAIARQHHLDLALIDIRLPDANGFQLARSLTTQGLNNSCTVLLMSIHGKLAVPDKIAAAGADGFIVNPVSPKDLLERAQAALALRAEKSEREQTTPTTDRSGVELTFFGVPTVTVDGTHTPIPAGRATELLATLAASCPASLSSERLAMLAWGPDSDVSFSAVYAAMSRLRSFLASVGAADILQTRADGYSLDMAPTQIDLVRFEQAAELAVSASAQDEARTGMLQEVRDRWQGPPFPDTNNHLLNKWNNRLTETSSRVSEDLVRRLLDEHNYAEAVSLARDLLDQEPWRESVWGLLVIGLYRLSRTNDALGTILEASRRLRDELGLEPGPTLVDLEMKILTHDPSLLTGEPYRVDG